MSTEYLIKEETLKATADKIRLYTSPVGDATHVFSWGTTQLPQAGVTRYYYETFDTELADASIGTSVSTSNFYSAGYAENDQGDTVPVLYESNGDAYYYVGQAEIGGQILDKWRKIEVVYEDEQQKWSTWDSDCRAYTYTECIVTVAEDFDVTIDPVDFPDKITDVYNAGLANGESELPTLDTPASNAEVLTGKEYIDATGTKQTGTMLNQGTKSTILTTAVPSYTIPEGYHNGNGKVSIISETKSITPTSTQQSITPTAGKVLSSVTVYPIPATYMVKPISTGLTITSTNNSTGGANLGPQLACLYTSFDYTTGTIGNGSRLMALALSGGNTATSTISGIMPNTFVIVDLYYISNPTITVENLEEISDPTILGYGNLYSLQSDIKIYKIGYLSGKINITM